MNSRWSHGDAQGKSDLDLLVYASRLIGAETTLVVWGGGNTSIKRAERDFRSRIQPVVTDPPRRCIRWRVLLWTQTSCAATIA